MKSSATISECGEYRYSLIREWDSEKPRIAWVMLNPSTADAMVDDPTIRKCIGFSKRLGGFGSMEVVNLYALRSTDPRVLSGHDDPVGPDNDIHLEKALRGWEKSVVVAWGASGPRGQLFDERVGFVNELCGGRAVALGFTKDTSPRHPSRLAYNSHPVAWPHGCKEASK